MAPRARVLGPRGPAGLQPGGMDRGGGGRQNRQTEVSLGADFLIG